LVVNYQLIAIGKNQVKAADYVHEAYAALLFGGTCFGVGGFAVLNAKVEGAVADRDPGGNPRSGDCIFYPVFKGVFQERDQYQWWNLEAVGVALHFQGDVDVILVPIFSSST
jgi:hypothetical protein